MGFYDSHWVLTFLIFAPLVGAVIALFAGQRAKHVALITGIIEFLVAAPLFWTYQPMGEPMQNQVAIPWLPDWGIYYRLGLDGISLFMVILTAFLLPLAVLG
jgi:NADH-quinone oxidoreductase subunit M